MFPEHPSGTHLEDNSFMKIWFCGFVIFFFLPFYFIFFFPMTAKQSSENVKTGMCVEGVLRGFPNISI